MKYILLFLFSVSFLLQTASASAQVTRSNSPHIAGVGSKALANFPFDPFQNPSLLFIENSDTSYSLDSKAYQTFESDVNTATLNGIIQESFQSMHTAPIRSAVFANDTATQITFLVVNETATTQWVLDLSSSFFLPRPHYDTLSIYNSVTGRKISTFQPAQEKQTLTLKRNIPYIFTVSFDSAKSSWGLYTPKLYAYGSVHDTMLALSTLLLLSVAGGLFLISCILLFVAPLKISVPAFFGWGIFCDSVLTNVLYIDPIVSIAPVLFVLWLPFIVFAQHNLFKHLNAPAIVIKTNFFAILLSLGLVVACATSLLGLPSNITLMAVAALLVATALCSSFVHFLLAISDLSRSFIPALVGWITLSIGAVLTAMSITDLVPTDAFTANAYYASAMVFGLLWTLNLVRAQRSGSETTKANTKESKQGEQLSQKLQEIREGLDSSRLVQVLKREREIMKELREKDTQLTDDMKKEKEKADYANQAKSAFLAVISHEIRTPMTGIMGMVRLLRHSGLNNEQDGHVDTISDSGDAMMALLNDILDYEKIDTGKMEIESIEFDLYNLLQNVQSLMVGRTDEKNIELRLDVEVSTPQFICGDPTRLRQIFLNLISNAIKFTEEGHVSLQAKRLEQKDGKTLLYFAIQDTGIGIPKEAQENLFNPFSQADSATSRKYGGSGLGLAICQKLVNAMGGDININSAPGEGSNFFFSIQLPAGKENDGGISLPPVLCQAAQHSNQATLSPKASTAPVLEGMESVEAVERVKPSKPVEKLSPKSKKTSTEKVLTVMVVDDNAINQKVVAGLIGPLNHKTVCFNSGQAAIDEIKKNETQYDIVLMDIEMPGISGVETTRIIRQELNISKEALPVVALTGNTDEHEITSYLATGMTGFLAKPIEMDKLEETLNNCKVQEKAPVAKISLPTPPPTPKQDIKEEPEVIDFSRAPAEPEQTPLQEAIKQAPVSVPEAPDISAQKVDFELDNTEVIHAPPPKSDEDNDSRKSDLSAMNTGLSIDEPTEEEIQAETDASYNPADFDSTTLMSLKTSMDPDELRSMISDLLDKLNEINIQISAAVMDDKIDLVRARAHDLKGMAGNFGLVGVNSRSTLIEDAIKSGGTASKDLKRLRDQLNADIQQAAVFLEKWMA